MSIDHELYVIVSRLTRDVGYHHFELGAAPIQYSDEEYVAALAAVRKHLSMAHVAKPREATAERALPAPAGARPAREAKS